MISATVNDDEEGTRVGARSRNQINQDYLAEICGRTDFICSAGLQPLCGIEFVENDCLRLAASLSYTSMLAIVPLTAIAFSMLAAFPVFEGVREEFQTVLFKNFLPTSAEAMRVYFDQFVSNTAELTAVGIVGLAFIAVLLLGTIESALNAIFRVIRPRALLPRLLVFWDTANVRPVIAGR